jgi:hypothetical protein
LSILQAHLLPLEIASAKVDEECDWKFGQWKVLIWEYPYIYDFLDSCYKGFWLNMLLNLFWSKFIRKS